MSCPDHQNLSAFVDGELEATQALEVERHVAACASCRQFVHEMQWLDDYGRAALDAIHVGEAAMPSTAWWRPLRIKWARPMSLAAAAAVVLAFSIWTWFALSHSRNQTQAAAHQIATPNATKPGVVGQSRGSRDIAFAQWAAPYQKLQIPLVPMDIAANYNPAPVLPILPDNN